MSARARLRDGRPTLAARGGRVLVAIAAALVFACGNGADDERYVTEAVDRGDITTTVTATGSVNPVTTVQVGTYVSGPIREIDVDFNSPVTKGQRVAKIDPAPFLVRVRQAEANVADARARIAKSRADLALKRLTLERTRELAGRKLIAQNDYDTAKSQHDQAVAQIALDEAALAQAEAALEEARINLGYTDIVSPVDGVVVSRNVDVGQTVAASFQTPTLFEIAEDLTRMQVNTSVSESDIGGVHEGQPARFGVDAYPGRTFEGAVTQVRNAPTVVQNVVTYDVVIAVANPSLELKPGMTASVTITTAERTQALRLPVRALRFHPELAAGESPPPGGEAAPGVWIVEDGELRRVEVSTGLRNDRHAELLDGSLAEGARVVVAMKRTQETRTPPTSPFQPGRRR